MQNDGHLRPTADAALHRNDQRRTFQIHAIVFAMCTVVIAVVNAALNAAAGIVDEWWAWWSVLAAFGWGIGVAVHGLVVRLAQPAAGAGAVVTSR